MKLERRGVNGAMGHARLIMELLNRPHTDHCCQAQHY